ncbi:hypothetical protein OSB04_021892 [Centaurea solstitialis]|uniref:Photosynthesis system II assembly factor Ycf48/Hcf136-like domain-containing protein n=1 Tax=Centaurea solstitialis TaxID=347529 RepID=A0AA38WGP3_9ASTR|nr:hypothetical protein OSB04_021892 [Centaurea solstitialis]
MVAAKLLTDCSNPITTAINPSSLLNSLFNHRHPAPNGGFCNSRSFQQHHHQRSFSAIRASGLNRREFISDTAAAGAAALSLAPIVGLDSVARADALSEWERVFLPIDPGVVLLDIAFVPDDPSHGFLLGTRQTLLETKDGGSTWVSRSISSAEDEDFNYRFNAISFKGKEGWIVGKPAILLHTSDSGDSWERIPLSAELPGDMVMPKLLHSLFHAVITCNIISISLVHTYTHMCVSLNSTI